MKKLINLFILLFFVNIATAQLNLYVSPKGNDKSNGSLRRPFKTLQGAKDYVKKHKNEWNQDIYVNFRGGNYAFEKTIDFSSSDSNVNGKKVVYQAYQDEIPVFNAGIQITNWVKHDRNIWRASAKGLNFRQLYLNDTKLIRARYPDNYYKKVLLYDFENQDIIIPHYGFDRVQKIKNVEMHLQQTWTQCFFKLDEVKHTLNEPSYLPRHTKIQPEKVASDILFGRAYPPKYPKDPYHFENDYGFISISNEWYLDLEKDSVYLQVDEGVNLNQSKVIAPNNEMFFNIVGDENNLVENIEFDGLWFKYSNWNNQGYSSFYPIQAAVQIAEKFGDGKSVDRLPPSSIYVKFAKNVNFKNNVFTQCGNVHMIFMHEGVKNCLIEGNVFKNLSGGSLLIGHFGDILGKINELEEVKMTEHIVVANNYISQIGEDYLTVCGLTAGFVRNVTIEHNEIAYTPYSGISLGWGWHVNETWMENNFVRHNHIHHSGLQLADAGGIYVLSYQANAIIEKNLINHITRSPYFPDKPSCGIYLDEGSGGSKERPMIVRENVSQLGVDKNQLYFFHMPGILSFERNFNYPHNRKYLNYWDGNQVKENAGLTDQFKAIKSKL